MKNILKNILFASLACVMGFSSCTDYLEQDSESVLSKDDAFKNFRSFQGYVEVMPNLIPDIAKAFWVSSFNWGEDEIVTTGNGEYLMGNQIDGGNYRAYIDKTDCFLRRVVPQTDLGRKGQVDIWNNGWYAIRQANMGLQAINDGLLTDATTEERNIIKGELLFWRAWFYFQLTSYWGGLPYMTEPLSPSAQFTLPRETYAENAEKMAADFEEAAKLLPLDWDKNCAPGNTTKGNNDLRPNKIWAQAYLGKTLLYAASPLSQNGVYTKGDTYQYNTTLAKRAAEVLGGLLANIKDTRYSLVDFEDYHTLFWTKEQNWLMPGGTEAIMRSPTFGADSYWRQMNSYQIQDICTGDGIILCPTANYINYAYGMANGEPIYIVENGAYKLNAASGFDPEHPWKDRDPRFYNDIMYDGCKMVKTPSTDSGKKYEYANFYNGGNGVENPQKTSRTGYLLYKFIPLGANTDDNDYGYAKATHLHLSWLRLAEVYLMYAEALAATDGAKASAGGCSLTAEEAVNTIRARAGVEGVSSAFTADKNKFMDEVRRERAVELAFEGHRFHDLRRWKLLTEKPYTLKTMQKFDRAEELDPKKDTKENGVKNWAETVLLERNFGPKHYWMPFKNDDIMLYPEFNQNPGW